MNPNLLILDVQDSGLIYAESSGEFFTSEALRHEVFNLAHFFVGKFSVVMRLSSRIIHHATESVIYAVLSFCIISVVLCRTCKKMIGPDTASVVALVANEQSIGNRAEVYFPRHSVSTRICGAVPQVTVAIISVALPLPAPFLAFGYVLPKSFLDRSLYSLHGAHSITGEGEE